MLSILGLSSVLALSGGVATAPSAQAVIPQNAPSSSIVATDSAGSMWSYAAPGNTRIGARTAIISGWKGIKQIVSADWNDDNYPDIITRWGNGNLTLQTGQYNGTYRPHTVIGNGWQNFDITITKLSRSDFYPGIIARGIYDGKLYYYPNSFGGGIGSRTTIGTGGWQAMSEVSAVDYDRDGGMDLIARSNRTGNLHLYRTNGMGSFVSESRKTIGTGWNPMTSISIKTDFAGRGTVGLLARNAKGGLYYYALTTNRINAGKHVGNGWNGYTIAENAASAAATATRNGLYERAYSAQVYNYMKKWCPSARIYLNHYSVNSGDVYGMMWWGTSNIAIRTDIPASITKSIALHECGHQLQARAYGYNGKNTAVARMKAIYGGTGTYGLEENADCIAAYLNPYAAPAHIGAKTEASVWATQCTGYKGTAAKLIIQGKRP